MEEQDPRIAKMVPKEEQSQGNQVTRYEDSVRNEDIVVLIKKKHLSFQQSIQSTPICLEINKEISHLLHKTLNGLLSLTNGSYLNVKSMTVVAKCSFYYHHYSPPQSTFWLLNYSKCLPIQDIMDFTKNITWSGR